MREGWKVYRLFTELTGMIELENGVFGADSLRQAQMGADGSGFGTDVSKAIRGYPHLKSEAI